ncbi:Retrovirus-related Pol polyprotein from transposon TNT 1-94 [Durusdinium trenchii]|uniref:Retrovirus-related Pol polyprotein from transposon TNT 1-94 n=1 Tax=Durusdinium trenchii TaxID=1381693 RepID=A0ABP0M3P5_9DINO
MMKNYALSLKPVNLKKERRQQLESSLTEEEKEVLNSSAGELGWLSRQLRCDLAFENGCAQRCKADPCIADLLKLKGYLGAAKRAADFRMRYWSDVNLAEGVMVMLSDSGHANNNEAGDKKFRSVGFFILIANPGFLHGDEVRCNVLSFHSGTTKRVCRSTLAAEASHLAEAVEAGDWMIVLLEEALTGELDLKNWPEIIKRRQRVYVTDAKSVYDYLEKDSTSTSSDKRMAIEGALLRETVRQDGAHVRWIDGMQNIADVLTKMGADKTMLREFLRTGKLSLVQNELNRQLKEKKRTERQNRKKVKAEDGQKEERQKLRRQKLVAVEVHPLAKLQQDPEATMPLATVAKLLLKLEWPRFDDRFLERRIEQLYDDLRRADFAGDKEAVAKFRTQALRLEGVKSLKEHVELNRKETNLAPEKGRMDLFPQKFIRAKRQIDESTGRIVLKGYEE